MKIVLCQPTVLRFKWELKVLLNNLKELHFPLEDVVLLFAGNNDAYEAYFKRSFGVEAHTYPDKRADKSYIPSIKPYLWWKFLQENASREHEAYFYIDSDVIFRELPDFDSLGVTDKFWQCSDTLGYTNYDYLSSRPYGKEITQHMAQTAGVSLDSIKQANNGQGGAQWLICNPKADYWHDVYTVSNEFYKYFKSIPDKTNDNPKLDGGLQIWCAEMYAQLWMLPKYGITPVVSNELSFSWATDNISNWDKHKIFHNAGVTADMKDLFYKGAYIDRDPFDVDFSYVNPDKCSMKYVEAIKGVDQN